MNCTIDFHDKGIFRKIKAGNYYFLNPVPRFGLAQMNPNMLKMGYSTVCPSCKDTIYFNRSYFEPNTRAMTPEEALKLWEIGKEQL